MRRRANRGLPAFAILAGGFHSAHPLPPPPRVPADEALTVPPPNRGRALADPLYVIVGETEDEPFTLAQFVADNRSQARPEARYAADGDDFDEHELDAIDALAVDATVTLGGGAGGTFTIRRVS